MSDNTQVAARRSLLPWIVAFKAFKAATLLTLGVSLIATRHQDPIAVVSRVALAVHVPLTSALFDRAVRFATGLTMAKELALAVTAFGYAVLMGTEGVGLYFRRTWARWFTIVATGSLIPIELYEIMREVTIPRIAIMFLNLAVVAYLARRRELFD